MIRPTRLPATGHGLFQEDVDPESDAAHRRGISAREASATGCSGRSPSEQRERVRDDRQDRRQAVGRALRRAGQSDDERLPAHADDLAREVCRREARARSRRASSRRGPGTSKSMTARTPRGCGRAARRRCRRSERPGPRRSASVRARTARATSSALVRRSSPRATTRCSIPERERASSQAGPPRSARAPADDAVGDGEDRDAQGHAANIDRHGDHSTASAARSRNLRLSVTDRCNLRCAYCMPEKDYAWLPRGDILRLRGDRPAGRRLRAHWASTGSA